MQDGPHVEAHRALIEGILEVIPVPEPEDISDVTLLSVSPASSFPPKPPRPSECDDCGSGEALLLRLSYDRSRHFWYCQNCDVVAEPAEEAQSTQMSLEDTLASFDEWYQGA